MKRADLIALANEAANKIFDKPDFEPIRNQIFTRDEFQYLSRDIIINALLAAKYGLSKTPLADILRDATLQ